MFLGQTTDTVGPGPSTSGPINYEDDRTETLPGSDSAVETGESKPDLAKDSAGSNNTILLLLGAAAIYFLYFNKKRR